MILHPTPIPGACLVEVERNSDERGFFARTWCQKEFANTGIDVAMVQSSLSRNVRAGTVRGLHFTWAPSNEAKLVRCERGAICDVILDLRPQSTAYLQHYSLTLDTEQGNALYIPAGIAHGFQTLLDDSDVLYMMTDYYQPEFAAGVRFNDPAFNITWPRPVTLIAERDRPYPDFDDLRHALRYRAATGDRPGA